MKKKESALAKLVAAICASALCCTMFSCQQAQSYYNVSGFAQGSTYSITYSWKGKGADIQMQIDSILKAFDNSLSNYKPESVISRINKGDTSAAPDELFLRFWADAEYVYKATGGAFDISVAPIANYWGFGYEKKDSANLDSLMLLVGMDKISMENGKLVLPQGMSVIGNAIAQGLSVDIVAEYLESRGSENYLVEIGGELRAKGVNKRGEIWVIGIDKPVSGAEERQLQEIFELDGLALATSGNYRKFYSKDGVKYSHTIDPRTGYPVQHSLLSATAANKSCCIADAVATACMVGGLEWAKQLQYKMQGIELFLIYDYNGELRTWRSEGFPASKGSKALPGKK
jgi:FAD:protein FMN transferase